MVIICSDERQAMVRFFCEDERKSQPRHSLGTMKRSREMATEAKAEAKVKKGAEMALSAHERQNIA